MEQSVMKMWTRRDLTVVSVTEHDCLVIACDSCGSVGVKEGDAFKLPPRYTARFTVRVALTEVMCSGALPITITNGVACEMKPTGEETILGIQDELKNAGISDIILTGSTEENFATSMTALAITVIGTSRESDLRFKHALKGDKLILLGKPSVGTEVDLESTGFYTVIRRLLSLPEVKEIVPVGSKGIAHEADALAALNSAAFKPYKTEIDYFKSAGPATCLLVLCDKSIANQVLATYQVSTLIGEIQ